MKLSTIPAQFIRSPLLATLLLMLVPALASASHFRGGSISWQTAELDADGQRNDVVITVKTAWRADAVNSVSSLGSAPALTITQTDQSVIYVGGSGPGDSDYALQTTILKAHDLDADTRYLVNYSGSARIGGLRNNANGSWNIQSTIYLKDQNLAPKIDLPIIFQVPQLLADGLTVLGDWSFDIGSSDPNADKLRYRLANASELGGGGQANPAGLSINPNTGLLTWSGSGSMLTGLYSGGIVAEDVDPSGNPKSKSHVDFILDLRATAATAFTPSAGIPETRNVRVDKGTTFSFSISGAAIETQSLGDVQGALTEPSEGDFVFDPGSIGSGLDPATYPITFEIFDTLGLRSNGYLTVNFIVPDPNAPRIANLEGDRVVYNALLSQPIDENIDAVLTDIDNVDLSGGRLKANVTFTDGQFEILAIASAGDAAGEIRVSGEQIFYEGRLIGAIDDSLDGVGTALAVQFTTDDATLAAVQALVRSLTYQDTFVLRAPGDRALSVFIEDPEGHASAYDLFVDVEVHPGAPPPGGGPVQAANEMTIVEGATISLSDENVNYADPDIGDTVTITPSSVTNGQFELVSNPGVAVATFTQTQITLGQVAFAHDGSEFAPAFDLSASDGSNPPTDPSAATISFTNVADQAPVIDGSPATTVTENLAYSFTPDVTDGDAGAGSTQTFTVSNPPSWADFNAGTGELSGTPEGADVGTFSNIVITVTDDGGLSDSLPSFSIEVLADPDTDGDGVPDSQEMADGTDPADAGDYRDTDADGVPDFVESNVDGTDPDDGADYTDSDGDGVPDYVEENVYGSDPGVPDAGDTDGDGVPDYVETYEHGTDPADAGDFKDSDSDGVPDYRETAEGSDPNDPRDYADSDGDGVPDYIENVDGTDPNDDGDAADSDGDGVPDYVESNVDGTDPNDAADARDTDGDGVPDYVEDVHDGTDSADSSDFKDVDGDGVPDYVEIHNDGTDPDDAASYRDADGDGVPDYVETRVDGTDPDDANDFADSDADGVPDYVETNVHGTDPDDADDFEDGDGDGVPDYVEINVYGTDPNDAEDVADTDDDGVPDYVENGADGTDPADPGDYRDSDADGVPNYVEAVRDGTDPNDGSDFSDADGDGVPGYVETNRDETDPADAADYRDSDGDGVPDYVETNADGSDPADGDDFLDSDGDGVSDFDEDRAGTDPNDDNDAPVAMAVIDADGRFTKASLARLLELGLVAATDAASCCGDYRVSERDGQPMFAPGRNRIHWDGNGANVLLVRPQISLGPDKTVTEGQVATFRLYLNGVSPEYPLVVPYTVTGTAEPGEDHDLLADGAAVFLDGETEATVTFLVSDDVVNEGVETIVVTLDGADMNVGNRDTQSLSVVEGNLPAEIELVVTQNGRSGLIVSQAEGPVVVTAIVTDPNIDDEHNYDWSATNDRLDDSDTIEHTLTFDPTAVIEGVYEIDLAVADAGMPVATGLASARVRVVANLPILGSDDSDGDGISDADEGYGDADADGVPDWLDPYSTANVLQETAAETGSYLIECDPGTTCRLGAMAAGGESGGALLSGDSGAPRPGMARDIDYRNVGGIFDIETLTAVNGQSVRLVVPQRSPVPANASFRVHNDGSWRDFREDDLNRISSAPGEAGACPPPGDPGYTPGLAEGDFCVQLLLEDGGPNDVDGAANARAAITGGVGQAEDIVYHTNGGSGGGAFAPATLLLMLCGGLFAGLRRQGPRGLALRSAALMAVATFIVLPIDRANARELDDPWWRSLYLGANFGAADTNVSAGDLERRFANAGIEADIVQIDTDRSGWGLEVGLPITRAWGLEVGYQNLEQTDVTFSALSTAQNIADVYPESGDGLTLTGIYEYAFTDRAAVLLRAGLFNWQSDYDTVRLDNDDLAARSSASGTDFRWGVGASWRLAEPWSVDLGYERYEFEHEPADYFRVGVRWRFRH